MGTFFPTNGATDDVLIRLAPSFRERADGTPDRAIYAANLAIVEALVRQTDVPIAPTDERLVGVDLDGDGTLGHASRVVYRAPVVLEAQRRSPLANTEVGYGPQPPPAVTHASPLVVAGRAAEEVAAERVHLAPGRYPEGTEFLHSVRYLRVAADGRVAMAPRMKELRYMVKVGHLDDRQLRNSALAEAAERELFPARLREVVGGVERGVENDQGWRLQGFIEDSAGELRPQTLEESVFCVGCHTGIGAITDGTFAFPRRFGASAFRGGWYHWTQRGLGGVAEPIREDGLGEYATYLRAVHGGDEFRENAEVVARFFDGAGAARPDAFAALATDIATLLFPSPARARDLDRATRVTVMEQSYWRGRDPVVSPVRNVHAHVELGGATGITEVLRGPGARVGLP